MPEEKEFYESIRDELIMMFHSIGDCDLHVMADRVDQEVKKILGDDPVFEMERFRPDILGTMDPTRSFRMHGTAIVVVEVKSGGEPKFEDLYRLKRHAEILKAHYAFFISDTPLLKVLRRFLIRNQSILRFNVEYLSRHTRPLTCLQLMDSGILVQDHEMCKEDPFSHSQVWA